ncbi:MAG: hypothetical protein DRP81_09130, partial [Candidatus Omnitrophota bacterium]
MEFVNVQIYNNIIYRSGNIAPKQSPNLQIWNNIIFKDDQIYNCRGSNSKPTYSNYNCFYPGENFKLDQQNFDSLEAWKEGTGLDNNSIHKDPLFVNPESHGFHLSPTSPCLNAGIDRQDYDNDDTTTEPINMGAYITGNETIGLIDLSQYVIEEYPECSHGKITSPCQCGNQIYTAGFCCYHSNANSGIWFDPSYENLGGCPSGNFYFVDQNHPNASDDNPGTEDLPWKTITHAVQAVQAGDIVYVRAGTYYIKARGDRGEPALNPANSGSPGNYIVIAAYNGEPVTITYDPEISGPDGPHSGPLIGAYRKSYIKWEGFKIIETTAGYHRDTGPVVIACSDHIIVENCEIIGTYIPTLTNHDGIRIEKAEHVTIRNCRIHGVKGDLWNSGGIKLYYTKDIIIEHNEIYDCTRGFYDKDSGVRNIFRYNLVHDCDYGFMYPGNAAHSENGEVYQNIFYNCKEGAHLIDGGDDHGWKVYNNIFYGSERGILENLQGTHGISNFYNNIFSNVSSPYIVRRDIQTIADSDYNCFHNYSSFVIGWQSIGDLSDWQQQTGFGQHSIEADPLFTNPDFHNFHLQPSSPCLNAGIDRQDFDQDGNTTEPINMGAYITGNETIGLIDLSQYIIEESQQTCASQNGVCCNENQTCQNGIFISSSDCGNLCCTGECVSPRLPGDLNGDGHINVQDIQLNVNVILEIENRPDIIARADVNRDG